MENDLKAEKLYTSSKNKTPKSAPTKVIAKEDAKKAYIAKDDVKRRKLTSRPKPIQQAVLNEAKTQGGEVIYLEDSKGNRMHLIRVGKGKSAQITAIMTEKDGQVGPAVSAQTPEAKKMIDIVRREIGNPDADISKTLKSIDNLYKISATEMARVGEKMKTPELDMSKDMADLDKLSKHNISDNLIAQIAVSKIGRSNG